MTYYNDMTKGKNDISEQAAIQLLKRLFEKSPDKNSLTLDQLYAAAGRGQLDADTNRNWINNVMTKLRKHNFIVPNYTYDGRKKLEGVKLSATGKSILGRTNDFDGNDAARTLIKTTNDHVGIDQLTKTVSQFRRQNPDYEVTFRIELKEDVTPM